jgi:hypothetical protein
MFLRNVPNEADFSRESGLTKERTHGVDPGATGELLHTGRDLQFLYRPALVSGETRGRRARRVNEHEDA